MIKKSVFENDLIVGMQRELQPFEKKAAINNLVKAAEYLQSAAEIFEEAGMTAKADKILQILEKLAHGGDTKVKAMPSLKALMGAGVTHEDLANPNSAFSRARVNTALRRLGYTDREIQGYLGDKFMSEQDAADILNPERSFMDINEWFKNPQEPIGPADVKDEKPEISMKSLLNPPLPKAENISFADDGADENDARKPKDPTKVSDSHTKGLTPEKMLSNLEGHGTMFNMADDGLADDLLDLDLNEAAVELFGDNQTDKSFEDTD